MIYKVVLKDRKFWVDTAIEDYNVFFNMMRKRYGSSLKAVYKEDGINSLEDLKRIYSNK